MTASHHTTRRRNTLILGGAAIGLWMLVGLGFLTGGTSGNTHGRMGEPVLGNFGETRSDTQMIRFTLADENYSLRRTATGWTLVETGGYPIRPDRLADLANGLETLSFDEKRTADPYKHERIGLGHPEQDGNGALLEIFGIDDQLEHSLIIGRKNDAIYVRAPEATQTFRANGNIPPFYNRRAWLDLDIVSIEPAAIRSARITDASGETVYLRRAEGADTRSFRPAPPHQDDRLISRLAASTTALAITRLAPTDVKPASELVTQPIARHISETFDGLEIDLSAYREPFGLWVTLRAIEAGEGARRAETINRKAEGWAFRISDYDFQDFTPAVNTIVQREP